MQTFVPSSREHGANSEAAARATETANLAISVEEQSKAWLQPMQSRKRNLVKLHTAKPGNAKTGQMQLTDVNKLRRKSRGNSCLQQLRRPLVG